MRYAVIVLVMLSVTVPVFGQPSTRNAELNARFGALRAKQPKDSYRDLFNAQQQLKSALAKAEALMKPNIVCGMLMIPADPKVDLKMGLTPKKQDGLEFKMRAIEPPICNPAK